MRWGLLLVAILLALGGPLAAQPPQSVQAEREVAEAGRWLERLNQALTLGIDGFRDLSASMQALTTPSLTREKAAAAAPDLRRRIERCRDDLRRSEAMLDALTADPPPKMESDIPPAQLLADARAYNRRMLALLESYDGFIIAMGKSDLAGMERAMPGLAEGAFTLVGQQRLMLRNRQASVAATDSTYQSIGVAGQLYRAMEAVLRHSIAARAEKGAGAAAAAAALHGELGGIAADTRALAADGRRNLAREVAEIEAVRASDESERRVLDRVRRVYAAESKVFALADRLAAFAEASQAQLGTPGPSQLFPTLKQIELDYIAITTEQAAALAEGPQ